MEKSLPIIFWTIKFWKIGAFDYNQHIVLIMYTNAGFQSIGTTLDVGTKFWQKLCEWKNFWKNNH